MAMGFPPGQHFLAAVSFTSKNILRAGAGAIMVTPTCPTTMQTVSSRRAGDRCLAHRWLRRLPCELRQLLEEFADHDFRRRIQQPLADTGDNAADLHITLVANLGGCV